MAVQFPFGEALTRAFAGFDWDVGNREKCERHGVSRRTIEAVFNRPVAVFPDPAHSSAEHRFRAIGVTDEGRSVLIVFTLRVREGETLIRPIGARYMHRKEVAHYEEEIAKSRQR
ncbi:MAG: BrnT family toxin [Acetobacteraceae bacterium]|nr:BrnT family toxin [Acetobacteraceae bacterium]